MQASSTLDYTAVFAVLSELIEIGLLVFNASGEIEFASARGRELVGCGESLDLEACDPEIQERISELLDRVNSDGARSAATKISLQRDGNPFELSVEVHPIDELSCTGYLLLVRDQANVRKMVTDLRFSAQFRNTRRLYGSVVHELKQPISAILVRLDILRDAFTPEQNGERKEAESLRSLGVIRNQITELNHTLTLLLEEIAPAETEERGFSLRDVLADVIRLVEPQAAQQEVALDLRVEDHPARMSGSRQRIKQAILNVAVNALDAMENGGVLRLGLAVEKDRATVHVADQGPGIEADVLPHIFEMHYTTKDSGTGAGLYVAREVITRHGGEILVDTELRKGTEFQIRLPVSESRS